MPRLMPAAFLLGCAATPLALLVPLPMLIASAVALGIVVAVHLHPPVAAYLLVALTPLLAGLERSSFLPLLRPHEALAVVVASGLGLNAAVRFIAGRLDRPRFSVLDVVIVVMAFLGSAVPLLWLLARGRTLTLDDVLYALTFWKFYGVFLIIRLSVRGSKQVGRCLWLLLASGTVVALLAIAQSLQLLGVAELMAQSYPTEDPSGTSLGRGTSTLGSSHAVGDIMAFDLAIALGWLFRGSRTKAVLVLLAVVFLLGGLASGQFSAAIGLVLAVVTVAVLTGRLRQLALLVLPAAAVGAVALRPVIDQRLAGFDSTTGLPQSWEVRLVNLRTYFWPDLLTDHSYLLGVRPAARIATPEPWREYVYIESGYTWLLWVGGLPLVAAYVLFLVVAVRQALRLSRSQVGPYAASGIATAAALAVVVVLMALDPHLVLRGAADMLFTLLALVSVGLAPPPASRFLSDEDGVAALDSSARRIQE